MRSRTCETLLTTLGIIAVGAGCSAIAYGFTASHYQNEVATAKANTVAAMVKTGEAKQETIKIAEQANTAISVMSMIIDGKATGVQTCIDLFPKTLASCLRQVGATRKYADTSK